MIPAFMLLAWEWLYYLLPTVLKKNTVIHFLTTQVPLIQQPTLIGLAAEPVSLTTPILVLTSFTIISLTIGWYRVTTMDVSYAGE